MRDRDIGGGWGSAPAHNTARQRLPEFGFEPALEATRRRAKGPILLAIIGAIGLAGIGIAVAGGGSEPAAPEIIRGQFQTTVATEPVDPENDKPGM
jgi:hypothetical protein